MRWVVHSDFARGGARVLPWLDTEPVRNSMQAGVVRGVLAGLYPLDGSAVLAHAEEGEAVVGVAVRTPGRALILSAMPAAAAAALAPTLGDAGHALPGLVGPAGSTEAFADAWSRRTGCRVRLRMSQRVHGLDRVVPPVGVPGSLRGARPPEVDLVQGWAEAMGEEIGGAHADRDPRLRELLGRRIAEDRMALWQVDDEVVSMAGPSLPTAGVVRIALVYTPPRHRRHGYAAACVAAVSQRALDAGAVACSLTTDLANPTSNGVYRRIGYYPVGDVRQLTFDLP